MKNQTSTYQSPQEHRTARITQRQREQARKARRRKYMIRRVIALGIFVAALSLLIIGVRTVVLALTVQEETVKETNVPTYIVESPVEKSVETETAIEEPKEPTTEDLLASGVLTDDISLSYELQLCAREAAETFGVPYRLLLAVMFRESSYNPEAANDICYGLMQIHQMNFEWLEATLENYGVTDIQRNPEDNIYAGAYMLGILIDKYGDYHKALMAYNCGERGAKRLWKQGYITSKYSRSVLEIMEGLAVAE